MKRPADDLERLISRCLDHEATPHERRELEARLRDDPRAAEVYEQTRAIDHALHLALRGVVADGRNRRFRRPTGRRALHLAGLAAAACVGMLLWLGPLPDSRPVASTGKARAAATGTSWFAPPPTAGDSYVAEDEFEAAADPAANGKTRWILVPSEKPGEYLVIEVNRIPKRAVQLARDF